MRLRQPDVQRQQACLGAESGQREQERGRGPCGLKRHRAHRAEAVVAGVALEHAEAEQDCQRADVRDQQVKEAGAADLGDAVIGGDQEEGRERHRLPRDHEQVGVIGDEHARHRGEKRVVLEAQQTGRGALARGHELRLDAHLR